ncbi:MAG: PAS domain-containing protein [Methanosarcinaceae archaeon]|nr:PAS domain-containing protein [Methanosarcinaceae archaeon]
MWPLQADEVERKTDHEIFPEKKATYFCDLSRQIMETGETKRYEECIDDSKRRIFIETIKAPLFNEENKCIGVVGISRDITARKEADEMLRARVVAEAANRAKTEFFTSMSHEIRTPLISIISFSEMLNSGFAGELDEKQQKYIMNIHNSGNHLLDLINNLLDMSKIEAGKMAIDPEYFMMSETFQEISGIINALAVKKGVDLEFSTDEGIPPIYADKLRFKQIIYNLVSNAIKFTPEGGEVRVFAEKAKNMVRITVSDTGTGISEEEQKRLFRPFEQLDTCHAHEGTGLGLSLVKNMLRCTEGISVLRAKPARDLPLFSSCR